AIRDAIPAEVRLMVVATPPEIRAAYGLDPAICRVPEGATDWDSWLAEQQPWDQPPQPARTNMIYTSGTTGLPKGVVLAQRATEHRVLWLSTQAGLRHGSHNRVLGFMPLSHAIGFFGMFLVTLAFDGTYHVMSAFDPAAAVETIEREAITYLFAIPTLYHAMTRAPG
ncbi:MAG: AMP-binding protein, partial [Myxococcota bacterium]|nr:AMP-binding protein [Myxococcota bacterium]